MPFLVLLLLALTAGVTVYLLARAYPTAAGVTPPATEAAGEQLAKEAVRHPWFARLLRGRLDPGTATGLALTVALAITVVGGVALGALAYLVRSSGYLTQARRERRRLGQRPCRCVVDAADPVRDGSCEHAGSDPRASRRDRRRDDPRAEPVGASVLDHRSRRRGAARQHRQAASRSRPPHVQPRGCNSRPLFPERPFRDRCRAVRIGGPRPGEEALASRPCAPRRCCRGHCRRGCHEPGDARRALDVRCHRRPRLRLGLVLDLRCCLRRPVPQLRRAAEEGRAGRRSAAALGRRARTGQGDGRLQGTAQTS